MENISLLIKEAKPLYFKKKARKQKIKYSAIVVVCLLMFFSVPNNSSNYDYTDEEIDYLSSGSIIEDMGLPFDDYGLLVVV